MLPKTKYSKTHLYLVAQVLRFPVHPLLRVPELPLQLLEAFFRFLAILDQEQVLFLQLREHFEQLVRVLEVHRALAVVIFALALVSTLRCASGQIEQ
jgi:hypothetical protein